jgi:blocked-early-in-transport protein 1
MEDISRSVSPMPNVQTTTTTTTTIPTTTTGINNDINKLNTSNTESSSFINISTSPYERSKLPNYSTKAAEMAMLESQSDDTMNEMKFKLVALKDLSIAMGDQINKSKQGLVELGEDMGLSSERIKWNMGRMRRFVEQSGVSWRVWLGFTIIIMWWFIWVWLF